MRAQRCCPLLRPVTGEEAAGEHAVGSDADPELAAGGQDLLLDPARDERVLDLHVGDGCTACARRIVSAPDLGEAEVADVAGLDQLGDRTDRLLDRESGKTRPGR